MTRAAPAALGLCAALALGSSPARGGEAGYVASVQAELRERSPFPGDVSPVAASDFELLPRLSGYLSGGGVRFELGYTPSFIFRDFFEQQTFLPLHRANAALQWQGTHTLVAVRGDAAKGLADFGPLLTDGNGIPLQVPASTTLTLVPYVRLAGAALLEQHVGGRVTLRAEGGYEVSGSTQNVNLPLQWGPAGLLAVKVDVTGVDSLTTTALGKHADFMTGQRQTLLEGTERWARHFSRELEGELAAGVGVVQQSVTDAAPAVPWEVLPVAAVGVSWRAPLEGSKLELRGRCGLAPFADRFTATVYERLDALVAATWTTRDGLTVGLGLSGARSFAGAASSTSPDFFLAIESSLAWAAQPWLTLGTSLRAAHTEVLVEGATPVNQWLVSAWVALHSEGRKSW